LSCALVWFRHDLRLLDQPALLSAFQNHQFILPLYIYDETLPEDFSYGGAQKWWLQESLKALSQTIQSQGGTLILRKGNPLTIIPELVKEYKIEAVYFNRLYHPALQKRDQHLTEILKSLSLKGAHFNSHLLFEPFDLKNQQGEPYQVFTSFWKAIQKKYGDPRPCFGETSYAWLKDSIPSDTLEEWNLYVQRPHWAAEFSAYWQPGEEGALKQLQSFVDKKLMNYRHERDYLEGNGISSLSPYLALGNIAPWRIWHTLLEAAFQNPALLDSVHAYLRQLIWREFAYYLLQVYPSMAWKNVREKFDAFPWTLNEDDIKAWKMGRTGYEVVDAAMHELWRTGFMHNRARLIVGSFLVKHLLIDWRVGERWFYDTLVDADYAVNAMNWQWVAGCGVDAAPYFRIFNPLTQQEKFDPRGQYCQKWKSLPDLSLVPEEFREQKSPSIEPIIGLQEGRERALKAFHGLKN
jgi:deoxyribodipyrimidine photo-lyase